MPGITGFVTSHWTPEEESRLHRMHSALWAEPFHETGRLIFADLGIAVAWTLSPAGARNPAPLWSNDKSRVLVFNGEDGLHAAGTLRDFLEHYDPHRPAVGERLNGIFSGALIDIRNRSLVLINDRYALGRIYYRQTPARFVFSSEAKAILRQDTASRTLDPASLGEWLSCGCVLQNRSLYSGISLLPAAASWRISGPLDVRDTRYFSPTTWIDQPELPAAEYTRRLIDRFPDILYRHLGGAEPVGMSITGGLDGRTIMAWARRAPGQLPCYTFNGPYGECADLRLGRRLAEICNQPHQTISVGANFLADFRRLARETVAISDGQMDVSGAVELYVNRLARAISPIRATGNYGSEILRGNVAFRAEGVLLDAATPALRAEIDRAAATYAAERATERLAFIAFKQVPWHHYARYAIEQSQMTMRSPFLDNELVGLVFQAPVVARTTEDATWQLIRAGSAALADIPTDRQTRIGPTHGFGSLKRRISLFRTKTEYALDYGMPQIFAQLINPWLPRAVERRFLGYQKFYHFRTWYEHELAPFVREVLLDPKAQHRGWFQARAVEKMVKDHTLGRGNFTTEIHKLLSLELLHQELIDN